MRHRFGTYRTSAQVASVLADVDPIDDDLAKKGDRTSVGDELRMAAQIERARLQLKAKFLENLEAMTDDARGTVRETRHMAVRSGRRKGYIV